MFSVSAYRGYRPLLLFTRRDVFVYFQKKSLDFFRFECDGGRFIEDVRLSRLSPLLKVNKR